MGEVSCVCSETLLTKLANANHVAVLTGAGISAESGVPTFRGENGLWKQFRAEELANFNAFMRNPELVWEWYLYRRRLINEVQPNPAHYTLAEMEAHYDDFSLSTQNVDGLHRRAGSKRVFELHGNITRNKCSSCGRPYEMGKFTKGDPIPCCGCGGYIRPDVVWFGEMLPETEMRRAAKAAQKAEVYFSIGTSAQVYPAALLPIDAKRAGAYVVEINAEPTPISSKVDESIIAKAGEALPDLWKLVMKRMPNSSVCNSR
jgi:NAD-dependent deacetylase